MVGAGQVANKGRLWVPSDHIQHIAAGHAVAAEPPCVGVVPDLQDPPSDVVSIAGEKILEVVAVDGLPPVKAELVAYGRHPPQAAEAHGAHRRPLVQRPEIPEPSTDGPCPPRDRLHQRL
jgi:hypothetical protein